MPYQVIINKKVVKTLAKTNEPDYSNIKEVLFSLADNPRPYGYIQMKGRDAYRIRVGNYRIIYEVFDDKLIVQVIDLGHRKEIYK